MSDLSAPNPMHGAVELAVLDSRFSLPILSPLDVTGLDVATISVEQRARFRMAVLQLEQAAQEKLRGYVSALQSSLQQPVVLVKPVKASMSHVVAKLALSASGHSSAAHVVPARTGSWLGSAVVVTDSPTDEEQAEYLYGPPWLHADG